MKLTEFVGIVYVADDGQLTDKNSQMNSSENEMTRSSVKTGMSPAQIISALLHPFLLAPVAFFYFSMNGTDSLWFGFSVWFITFLVTNLLIGIYVFLMKQRGHTTSVDVPELVNRRRPFLVGTMGYIAATIILYFIHAPVMVTALMSVYAVNTAIATVISLWWKISIHGMAIGGTIVPFIFLYGGAWWLLILLIPVIIYARVRAKAHTPAQVIFGVTMAFCLTWIQLQIWIPGN